MTFDASGKPEPPPCLDDFSDEAEDANDMVSGLIGLPSRGGLGPLKRTTSQLSNISDLEPTQLEREALKDLKQQLKKDEQNNGRNLIVNYLPPSLKEDDVVQYFAPYGKIEHCKVVMDLQTQRSKGYGFVKFYDRESAKKAMNALNGMKVMNKQLKVAFARKHSKEIRNSNLYVTHLPKNLTDDGLRKLFEPYGTLVECRVLKDNVGNCRGVGFVRYDTNANAVQALNNLNKTIPQGFSHEIRMKIASKRAPPEYRNGAKLAPPTANDDKTNNAKYKLQASEEPSANGSPHAPPMAPQFNYGDYPPPPGYWPYPPPYWPGMPGMPPAPGSTREGHGGRGKNPGFEMPPGYRMPPHPYGYPYWPPHGPHPPPPHGGAHGGRRRSKSMRGGKRDNLLGAHENRGKPAQSPPDGLGNNRYPSPWEAYGGHYPHHPMYPYPYPYHPHHMAMGSPRGYPYPAPGGANPYWPDRSREDLDDVIDDMHPSPRGFPGWRPPGGGHGGKHRDPNFWAESSPIQKGLYKKMAGDLDKEIVDEELNAMLREFDLGVGGMPDPAMNPSTMMFNRKAPRRSNFLNNGGKMNFKP